MFGDDFHEIHRKATEHHREADRFIKRTSRMIMVVWVFYVLVVLAILGVGIWAVIQLVGWVTS